MAGRCYCSSEPCFFLLSAVRAHLPRTYSAFIDDSCPCAAASLNHSTAALWSSGTPSPWLVFQYERSEKQSSNGREPDNVPCSMQTQHCTEHWHRMPWQPRDNTQTLPASPLQHPSPGCNGTQGYTGTHGVRKATCKHALQGKAHTWHCTLPNLAPNLSSRTAPPSFFTQPSPFKTISASWYTESACRWLAQCLR
jgi:hypothetical protein